MHLDVLTNILNSVQASGLEKNQVETNTNKKIRHLASSEPKQYLMHKNSCKGILNFID